jgi:[acyl-carrier-protein] S-malonyltransferase
LLLLEAWGFLPFEAFWEVLGGSRSLTLKSTTHRLTASFQREQGDSLSKIAFLFPGQGAQTVGMAKELCGAIPEAKQLFERASKVLGYDLADVCFNGPAEKLNSTVVSQPALYVSSMAALEKLKLESPEVYENCQGAAGLSLGEYTAIAFAGAMSFEDGLKLVQRRGQAMQEAADETPSSMVSVLGLDREQTEKVCDAARVDGEVLQVANLLCKGNIAVSGDQASCDRVPAAAEAAGAMKCISLAVAGAFHTPIMGSAVAKLTEALADVEIQPTRMPVYSNVDASPHTQPGEFKELLVKQVCGPVLWQDSIERMLADGYDEFYEVGVGRVLRSLMKRINRKTKCHGVLE